MKMKFLENKKKRTLFIIILGIVTLILALFIAGVIYVSDYYHADDEAIDAFLPAYNAQTQTLSDGSLVFEPEKPKAGFIFYPGGKVEHEAYIPLMAALSSEDILCVLVKMPFNLAVLDVNAADGIKEQFPEVENWYIGGHSLGGAMAASYLDKNREDFCGLILLAAYSTADLSDTDLTVLSVYGSRDGVMDRDKYNEYRSNLPEGFNEVIIPGGNHAYFGMYGEQDGDGRATITNDAQIFYTMVKISDMIVGA